LSVLAIGFIESVNVDLRLVFRLQLLVAGKNILYFAKDAIVERLIFAIEA
jgi:hypothetical protein